MEIIDVEASFKKTIDSEDTDYKLAATQIERSLEKQFQDVINKEGGGPNINYTFRDEFELVRDDFERDGDDLVYRIRNINFRIKTRVFKQVKIDFEELLRNARKE